MKILAPLPGEVRDLARSQDVRRYYQEWLILAVLALGTTLLFITMQWGASVGQVIYDHFHRWRAPLPGNDIVIIAIDDQSLEELGGWPLRRTVYAELLKRLADSNNHPLAIGMDILFHETRPEDEELARQFQRHRVFLATENSQESGAFFPAGHLSPTLARAKPSLVHINLSFESDGFLRGVRLLEGGTAQMAWAMSGRKLEELGDGDTYRRFGLVDPEMGFPVISLADALSGQFPLSMLKDKYVLIGAVAPSLGDHYPTIYSGRDGAGMPGVMLHANILNAVLHDTLITPVPMWVQLGLSSTLVVFLLLALLVLSPVLELVASISLALLTLLVSYYLLAMHTIWFDPGIPLLATLLLKPVWAWRRNEMVVSFMMDRVSELAPYRLQRKNFRSAGAWKPFIGDTVLQYSRVLDRLIQDASERLIFLNQVVQESPSAVLVVDALSGRILKSNARIQAAMPGQLAVAGQSMRPLLKYLGLEPMVDLLELAGHEHYVSALDPKGHNRHYMFYAAQLQASRDQVLWMMTLQDITEIREFQTQRERTLQLLSHDMRTPIASIMALTRVENSTSEAEMSKRIGRHARTLLEMMDDFILGIKANADQYQMHEVLLDEVVDEALYQVRDLANERQIEWRVDHAENPLFIQADRRLLIRVLANLMGNAVRYGQPQSIIEVHLDQEFLNSGECLACVTIDNRVAPAQNQSHDAQAKGFGLGLEFVKTVVRKHEGLLHMDISPVPGGLARVRCAFPLSMVKDDKP